MTDQPQAQVKKERVLLEHPLKFRIALSMTAGWSFTGTVFAILAVIWKPGAPIWVIALVVILGVGTTVSAWLALVWSDLLIARSLVGKEINSAEPRVIVGDPPGTHVISQNYT